jgi:hypothetical protein
MSFFYIFMVLIPIVVWLILMRFSRAKDEEETQDLLEVCALCQEEFRMSELLEKEVGEYGRVYCFCGGCIEKLRHEYEARRATGEVENSEDAPQ